jgi:hypothetical protein
MSNWVDMREKDSNIIHEKIDILINELNNICDQNGGQCVGKIKGIVSRFLKKCATLIFPNHPFIRILPDLNANPSSGINVKVN